MIIILAALTTYFLIFYNLLDCKAKIKDNLTYFMAAMGVSSFVVTVAFTDFSWFSHFKELYAVGIMVITILVIFNNRKASQNQSIEINSNDSIAIVNYKVIELNKHCHRISFWLQNIKHEQILIWQNPQTNHLQSIRKLETELGVVGQQIVQLTKDNHQARQAISARVGTDSQYGILSQQLENNLQKLPLFQKKLKQLRHLLQLMRNHVMRLLNAQKLSAKAVAAIERIAQKGQKLWNTYDDLTEESFWQKYNQLIAQTKQVPGL